MHTSGRGKSELISIFNEELVKVYEWTRANALSLNMDKTFAMVFSNHFGDPEINRLLQFVDQNIKFCEEYKFLCLDTDTKLNFGICGKVSRLIVFFKLIDFFSE